MLPYVLTQTGIQSVPQLRPSTKLLSVSRLLFVYSTHDVIRGYHILLVQAE